MTPLEIRIALHYYYSPEEWGEVYSSDPTSDAIISRLVEVGMLKQQKLVTLYPGRDGFRHVATEGLRVYAQALQDVPLPTLQWAMP